eukprot:TRINITY_DN649_c0_g1_i1.p2 TRINITY_DN649_c0_g1~~TRINITY_DN649_c0_g1_i1.p2  ORF type:complete len:51 (-),score=1.55 TRINITY_DN649_c0_g1_i1:10-162(-)
MIIASKLPRFSDRKDTDFFGDVPLISGTEISLKVMKALEVLSYYLLLFGY